MATTTRTDSEILKDLIDAICEYVAANGEEHDFKNDNGDVELYDRETQDEYQELCNATVDALSNVKKLIIEATGDEYFTF